MSTKINFKKKKNTVENQVQRTFSTNVFTGVAQFVSVAEKNLVIARIEKMIS